MKCTFYTTRLFPCFIHSWFSMFSPPRSHLGADLVPSMIQISTSFSNQPIHCLYYAIQHQKFQCYSKLCLCLLWWTASWTSTELVCQASSLIPWGSLAMRIDATLPSHAICNVQTQMQLTVFTKSSLVFISDSYQNMILLLKLCLRSRFPAMCCEQNLLAKEWRLEWSI